MNDYSLYLRSSSAGITALPLRKAVDLSASTYSVNKRILNNLSTLLDK